MLCGSGIPLGFVRAWNQKKGLRPYRVLPYQAVWLVGWLADRQSDTVHLRTTCVINIMFYVYSWNVYVWLAVNVFVFNNIMKNYHNFRFDENDIATWHQPRTVHHHNQTPQQLSNSQKLQPN